MDWPFFFHFFFFNVEPGQKSDTRNLPLVVCVSSTVTLCDREIYLGYVKFTGALLHDFFFNATRRTINSA